MSMEAQCGCLCHTTGVPTIKPSMPPQCCCDCSPLPIPDNWKYGRLELHIDPIKETIDKLEESQKNINEKIVAMSPLVKRIEELEKDNKFLFECIDVLKKKPHKCPVCEGTSKIKFTLPAGGYWEDQCKSCQGKGVIWR